jgi:hypothetical protein
MTRPDPAAPDSTAPDSTAPDSTAVLLDPEHVDELRRLLGTVEDWLLHASDEARDDLAAFLAALAWSTAPPEQLTAALIAELGQHTVQLRAALTRALPARETR